MNCRKRWKLAAAIAASLIALMALGLEASAEKLYAEKPAELRSSPGDDSQVVKRVAKGKSLEVVKRLGTWVMVEYEGRTGWIRRTALSADPVSSGGSEATDGKAKSDSKKDARKDTKRTAEPEADAEDPGTTKAAAAGAKRTAAKKKAEHRKTRSSRRATDEAAEDKNGKKAAAAEEEADDEEIKSGRPRSTWGARGLPGGPLKVEIQAISVQAFEEPTGKGRLVFTAQEGDRVRVLARGKDRWLLVENAKKRTGWIPAVAVRDHGLLLDARKDASASDDGAAEKPTASKSVKRGRKGKEDQLAEEDEIRETKPTRTAAASDGNGDEGDDEDADDARPADDHRSRTSNDDPDATLGSSSTDDMLSPRKPWTATGSLHGGFALVGTDVTPTGGTAEETSYNGPVAGLAADFTYHLNPKLGVVAALEYDYSTALGGLTYNAGGSEITDIKLSSHRIGVTVGASYGKRVVGTVRAGYQYAAVLIDDLNNAAKLPRETTTGPTLGLGFYYPGLMGKLGARLGLDALLLGSRTQTEGSRDGTTLDSLLELRGTAGVDYPVGQHLTVGGGYRFGYTTASWTGASDRNTGAMATDQKAQSHELNIGVGWRL